jgi:phospholipid/cholesterol/gamma-HCH transport system ATP-binding protein
MPPSVQSGAPQSSDPILALQDLQLKYGSNWALKDVSLKLCPGDTFIIFGAAGSGKTSLLKAVIGLVRVDEGTINLFGHDVTRLEEHDFYPLRSRAGILFQEGGLFDSLTVGENVEYPLLNQQTSEFVDGAEDTSKDSAQNGSSEQRVRESLRFVELEQTFDKFPSELSGGMRRRVGIARAIVTNPPLVLYDSPTAGLDPITANTIMALVAKQRETQQTASLIVTHRYQDGIIMADFRYDPEKDELLELEEQNAARDRTKFVVMKEGSVVFSGTKAELESSQDEYVKRFVRHEG